MAPNSVRSLNVAQGKETSSALANASTIAELVAVVPHSWRSIVGDQLTTTYRVAAKLCNVQNTLAQYDRHYAEGSFPASILNAVREPKIQFSKEFLGTDLGSQAKPQLLGLIHSARKSLLSDARNRKNEELATLQRVTAFDKQAWVKTLGEVANRVGQTFGIRMEINPNTGGYAWSGAPPSDVESDCKFLWYHGDAFHHKAILLARAIADRTLVEKTKALSLKKDTDASMRDADVELSTRDVVRDEMQAQIRLLETRLVRSIGQGKKSAPQKKRGGSNPSRVTKGPANKGKGKNKNGRKR